MKQVHTRAPWYVLSAPLQALLTAIGPGQPERMVAERAINLDWTLAMLLAQVAGLALMRTPPAGSWWQEFLFWAGSPLLFLPSALRIGWPGVARSERLILLLGLSTVTGLIKMLYWPSGFAMFDEFLHWGSAQTILREHRLFLANPMLPISPFFPGLELITTALVNVTGLSLLVAAEVVVALARGVFIASLFLLYCRISRSGRIAGLGCLAYMGASGYVAFDAMFAYETVAVAFLALIICIEAELATSTRQRIRGVLLMTVLIAALAVTHHVTSYEAVAMFAATAVITILGSERGAGYIVLTAGATLGLVWQWATFTGDLQTSYLGPQLEATKDQLVSMISGHGAERHYFVAPDGSHTSMLLQIPTVLAAVITAGLLACGFFASLARAQGKSGWAALGDVFLLRWTSSRALLITLVALCWPASIILRLTGPGWEIGNRIGGLAYFGVGLVAAVCITRWWWRPRQYVAAGAAVILLTVNFVGGLISGWGEPATRTGYKVEADALSLEPMAVQTARWTKEWLGEGNRFAADRDNSILLYGYGRQDIVTSSDGLTPGDLFVAPTVSSYEVKQVRSARVDDLMVDLRLSLARPMVGSYFESGESSSIHEAPLDPHVLVKWDDVDGVNRVYDSGWLIIYDVRGLREESWLGMAHR